MGEHEGNAYYVMQYIQGQGLDDVIEELARMRLGSRSGSRAAGREEPVSNRSRRDRGRTRRGRS